MVYEGSLVDKPAGTGVYSSGHRVLEDASPPKRGDWSRDRELADRLWVYRARM